MHTFFNCSFEAVHSEAVTKHLGSMKTTKKCSDISHEADFLVSSHSFFFPLKLNLAPLIRAKLTALNTKVICLLTGELQQGEPQDSFPHPLAEAGSSPRSSKLTRHSAELPDAVTCSEWGLIWEKGILSYRSAHSLEVTLKVVLVRGVCTLVLQNYRCNDQWKSKKPTECVLLSGGVRRVRQKALFCIGTYSLGAPLTWMLCAVLLSPSQEERSGVREEALKW